MAKKHLLKVIPTRAISNLGSTKVKVFLNTQMEMFMMVNSKMARSMGLDCTLQKLVGLSRVISQMIKSKETEL